MNFDKTKNYIYIYIVLGIISFISIVIALYFLFIKKKHYDCTKDPSCKSPSECSNNVCTYDCTKDPSCKSPSKCVDNVCIPYDCTKDPTCKSPSECSNNVCIPYTCADDKCPTNTKCLSNVCTPYTEVTDISLGFVNHAWISNTKEGYMSIMTNDPNINFQPDIFKIGDIIKTEDQDFPILSIIVVDNNMHNIAITTSNKFVFGRPEYNPGPFSRLRFSS